MARQNRDDPHSLEEQLAWLDAIKEGEDAPTGLDAPVDEPVSPYPKDPWAAVPAEPAPSPPPMFRAAVSSAFNPSPVAVADESAAETTLIGDAYTTRPVRGAAARPGSGDAAEKRETTPVGRPAASDSAPGGTAAAETAASPAGGITSLAGSGHAGDLAGGLSGSRGATAAEPPAGGAGGAGASAESSSDVRRPGSAGAFGGRGRGSVLGAPGGSSDAEAEDGDAEPAAADGDSEPRAAETGGSGGAAGRGTPASEAERSESAFGGLSGLGAFGVGGPAGTAKPGGPAAGSGGGTGSGAGDQAFGTPVAGAARADSAGRTGASSDEGVDIYLGPLPKADTSDPLGLGAFGDRGRDGDTYRAGSLGAFGPASRTPASSGSSASDSGAEKEPLRGWLEPAVPASSGEPPSPAADEDDDEEQRRFAAFMAGGDLGDGDTRPHRDRGRRRDADPADLTRSTSPDPRPAGAPSTPSAAPSTPAAASTPPAPEPPSREPRTPTLDPLTDPLTDPRLSLRPSSGSATWTDPHLRAPADPLRPDAAAGLSGGLGGGLGAGTGPQTPPRTDPASKFGDTGPQTPPQPDLGPFSALSGDSGPHSSPRIDPAAMPTAATPPAGEPAVDRPGVERSGQERRARSHRRPVPQQAFSAPPRPAATAAKPSADSLDPQTLLKGRRNAPASGWRRLVYKASGGWIKPGEPAEVRRRRELVSRARTPVANGHHRVAVLSLKGGVGKTTTTVGLGSTLAQVRGDRVIAVDANPDRGTLSDKVVLETSATVRDLLNERDQIQRYADIRAFTSQAPSRLEILASDRDPSISEAFSADDYEVIAQILENYYSICITDCGTGLLHSAMSGVLGLADQIVLVSSPSVDGARAASATLDWLEAHDYGDLVKAASVVLCSVRPRSKSTIDLDRLEAHFAARCRSVIRVPYDPHLEEGAEIDLDLLQPATLDAYLQLAASVGDGFAGPQY